jgi:hypothetical protein
VGDAVGGQQRLHQRQQAGLPLGLVDVERVDLVVGAPAGVGVFGARGVDDIVVWTEEAEGEGYEDCQA